MSLKGLGTGKVPAESGFSMRVLCLLVRQSEGVSITNRREAVDEASPQRSTDPLTAQHLSLFFFLLKIYFVFIKKKKAELQREGETERK